MDRVGAAPVTNVFGVSATTGRVLADAGVATVAALANANAADLAGFFGDPARAAAAVNAARLRVGL
jgi:predicted RecB family nuclease